MKPSLNIKFVLAAMLALTQYAGALHAADAKKKTADDSKDGKDAKVIEAPSLNDPWELKLAMPGWVAGISGDLGVKGISTHVDIGADQILKHLDSTFSFAGELRNGRIGFYGDFLYLNLSDTASPNGSLLSGVAVRLDEYIGDFDVNYRIVQGDRGWVDALAGFRIVSISQQMNPYANMAGINAASTNLVNNVAAAVNADVHTAVVSALDRQLAVLKGNNSALPIAPLAGPGVSAIESRVEQIIKSRAADLASAVAAADQPRINAIKAGLTNRITNAISSGIATPRDQTDEWVDPYIGVRGRLNLNKAFYITGKTDVGGFSVGSKISFEAYGALGCQVTKNIYAEAGYKYLYIDYDSGGFLYKTATQGAMITVGMNF